MVQEDHREGTCLERERASPSLKKRMRTSMEETVSKRKLENGRRYLKNKHQFSH
jgi:hypothetical protein